MTTPFGCTLTPLNADDCIAVLDAILGEAERVPETGCQWLLMHCDAGVVWGRLDSGRWRLSSEVFPQVSPKIGAADRRSIQQARLFGKSRETLLWRVDRASATFAGRTIEDVRGENVEAPLEDKMLLLGDRVFERKAGFSLIGDATGACHAVPVDSDESALPLTLSVKHYFELTEPSGALRISATRVSGLG